MKKRFLGLFLVFAMLFACVPGMAARAAGTDLSANVKVTDFRFLVDGTETTVLTPGKTVTAECKLERTAVGTGAQNYCFILQVIDNGKLIDLKKITGSISAADGKKTISVASAALGQDTAKYEVVALLVSDMTTMAPLAMPANFKNSTCDIASITVAGNKVPLEAGKTDYSMDLNIMESEMPPAIEVIPYDLSTDITVNNISGDSGTATVTAVSHDGKATVQYNIALNITTLKPASLKSVTVDGTPLEGFDPNTLEYRINGKTTVPVIAFEKALETTQTTVIAATELPGTTVVKTKAADGSELTYKFQFTKTVEVSPYKAAEAYGSKMGISAVDTMASFLFNNGTYWNLSGEILSVKGGSESKAYIAFQPNLPAGAIVESAKIDLTLKGVDGKGANAGKLHFDLYENTDTTWTANADGQYTLAAPAYGSSTVNDELIIPVGDTFNTYTYNIDPSTVQGKDVASFTGIIREGSAWDTLFLLRTRTADMPKLKITYYKDYVEPEKLASVTFDGKPYPAFNPNTYEYKIPSTDGQTTSPVIAATAGSSTTEVTVTQASGFPGKATVTTKAADGTSLTYTFLFLKTIEITPANIAQGKYPSTLQKMDPAQFDTFQSYNYGGTGEMLTISWSDYTSGTSYSYMGFQPNLPLDALVDSAELDLYVNTYNSMDSNPLHLDLFENTDISWMSLTAGETTGTSLPAISTAKLNTNDIDMNPSSGYVKQTYPLNTNVVAGKQTLGIGARTRELSNSYGKYNAIAMKSGYTPVLRVNYYKEGTAAAEAGKVTAVSIDGVKLNEFTSDQYEYVIKTAVGATEIPEITYTLADNTTATYTPATTLPGTATIVTSGDLTYTFRFAKTVQVTAAAAAVSLTTGGKNLVRAASEDLGNYFFSSGRINRSGRIFVGNTYFKDKAHIAFQPGLPANAVIESAELDLGVSVTGNIQHISIYENTDISWMSTTGESEAAAPSYGSAVLNNEITLDSSYTKQTYKIDAVFQGRSLVSFTIFTKETTDSWSDYATVELRDVTPTLRISYYTE